MKKLLWLDWDAVAGIAAAVAALVMHFLHVVQEEVLLMTALALLALLFLRDLRRERAGERMSEGLQRTERIMQEIRAGLKPADAILVGPRHLRAESERFSRQARGEMVWFHVCLEMFRPQPLFDSLLRPAIENPLVSSIQLVLDEGQKDLWARHVLPKISACSGREKVREPCWRTIKENVSFILADSGADGRTECLLSFWGEPFMSHSVQRDVPRYIFLLPPHSELVARLSEMERNYRIAA